MEEVKEKNKTMKQAKIMIVMALLIVFALAGTYAWMMLTKTSTVVNKITAGSLDLILDESSSDGILLQNQDPMSYQQGLTTQAYTFKLKNNSATDIDYTINLVDDYEGVTVPTEGKLEDSKLRYIILEGDETPVASKSRLLSAGRGLKTGTIEGNQEINYTLYMWIDSKAGLETNGQIFSGKLNILANQSSDTLTFANIDIEKYNSVFLDAENNSIRSTITEYKRVSTMNDTYKTDDYMISTSDSTRPLYMWVEDVKVNWYSEAGTVYLPEDSSGFFANMPNLTSLDLKDFNTSKVTNMTGMISGSGMTSLDFSSFDTTNVTNMTAMFQNSKITSLDLSDFDTSKVTNMTAMFYQAAISEINLSSFNTSNVTTMQVMFNGCSNLTSVNVSSFDTSKVTDMVNMFGNCPLLTTLDLSSFDTSKATNIMCMFCSDAALKTIYASNKFVTTNIANPSNHTVFGGVSSIVGGNGTTYDTSHLGADYARIDTASTPGYFTAK